jgi:hypothetical protein
MQRIFWVLLIVLAVFVGSTSPVIKRWTGDYLAPLNAAPQPAPILQLTAKPAAIALKCDGRTHCSQMTSCAEARSFLQNCPGTEMDGDGDGVPCESQWCK